MRHVDKIRRSARSLRSSEHGATSTIFAFSAIALCGMLGLSIDLTRYVQTRQTLQNSLDQATLAVAAAKQSGQSATQEQLQSLVEVNWKNVQGSAPATATLDLSQANTINTTAVTQMPTTFAAVLGFEKMDVSVQSTSMFGVSLTEIAMALDVTGSMAGAKIAALKLAAKDLVSIMYAPAGSDQKVRISVIPFGNYVNVGMAYRNQSWMSVPPDSTSTYCYKSKPVLSKSGCTTTQQSYYVEGSGMVTNDVESCTYYEYGPEVETCGPSESKWYGCVGSRNAPYNTRALATSAQPIPGLMNLTCSNPLLRLTNQQSDLNGAIDSLVATGETYLPAGLIWGWRTLSVDTPFADSRINGATKPRRALVFMTDGQNTRSQDGQWHWGSDASAANTLTETLCAEIKKENIDIFTVAFEVTDAATISRLKSCATTPANFYNANDQTALTTAFKSIAGALSVVRLVK